MLSDSGRATANSAVGAVQDDPERFRLLMNISFREPYPACMRAARVAQLCCERNPSLIVPYLDEVVAQIAKTPVGGVKRNFLKVVNEFSGPEKIGDPGLLVQLCFDWLMSPKEDAAVRMHCAEILYKLSLKEPGLQPELISVLRFVKDEGSTGFRNACKKILKKLFK